MNQMEKIAELGASPDREKRLSIFFKFGGAAGELECSPALFTAR